MKLGYGDPPYIGQASRHYKNDPSGIKAEEVDHVALVNHLLDDFDGFALSCSSPTIWQIGRMFHGDDIFYTLNPDVRLAVWVKPHCSWKPWYRVPYTWEGVFFKTVRTVGQRVPQSPRDHHVAASTRTRGTHGAKPDSFCDWILDLVGYDPTRDTIEDLYPGSGAFTRAIERRNQR